VQWPVPQRAPPRPENSCPTSRPFRALRYDPEVVGDLGAVVAPPYDVVGPDLERRCSSVTHANAVRLDLPHEEPGEDPDERYRPVARWLAAWRTDGTLRKDPRPSLYVYEQVYRVTGTTIERTQAGSSTAATRAVRNPGVACCPTSGRSAAPRGTGTGSFARPVSTPPPSWGCSRIGAGAPPPSWQRWRGARRWLPDRRRRRAPPAVAGHGRRGPRRRRPRPGRRRGRGARGSSADGHHRYETALRYRDERQTTRSQGSRTRRTTSPDAVPRRGGTSSRCCRRIAWCAGWARRDSAHLRDGLDRLFEVTPGSAEPLVARHDAAGELPGRGAGWARHAGRRVAARWSRRRAFANLQPAGGGCLASARRVAARGGARVAGGHRRCGRGGRGPIGYTKSAAEGVTG